MSATSSARPPAGARPTAGAGASLRRGWRRWRRRLLTHRRALASLCVALAVLGTLRVLSPGPPPTEPVWVAARDLPSGALLRAGDLHRASYARGTAPDGLVTDVAGRTLASPLRRGEPVTDARLLGPGLTAAHPGRVALPVRLVDPATVELLRVGDAVDLLSTDPAVGEVTTVARRAQVVALPTDGPQSGIGGTGGPASAGGVVVLALLPDEVEPVSVAAVRQFLSIVWSR